MINVAFVQIHYPVTMGRYMWEALLRREDVQVWSTGPYSANWIPWKRGMQLPPSYVREPDVPLPMGDYPTVMYSNLTQFLPDDFKPDLWLETNGGLRTIGRPKGLYAVVGTDPHVLNDEFYGPARIEADYFFCMQTPYMREGDIWLPYAHDPIWHARTPIPWEERRYDVSLMGLMYNNRQQFFKRAKERGFAVLADTGKAYEDARSIYHETRVGFNWSSMDDTTARVFELMAMGLPSLFNVTTDLENMFKVDEQFLGFQGVEMALEKLQWLIDNPDEAEAIADRAWEAVQEHTWDARVETILKETGLL